MDSQDNQIIFQDMRRNSSSTANFDQGIEVDEKIDLIEQVTQKPKAVKGY